jgi:S-DNA-T family DNA segregation ATPase FtsK/SpoIIIE
MSARTAKSAGSRTAAGRKTAGKSAGRRKGAAERAGEESRRAARALERAAAWKTAGPILLFAFALLLGALIFVPGVNVWRFLHLLLFGLFGPCAYVWPPVLLYVAVMAALDRSHSPVHVKLWETFALLVLLGAAVHIFTLGAFPAGGLPALYRAGGDLRGGGVFGGLIGGPLFMLFGRAGAAVTVFLLIFVFVLLVTGITLRQLLAAAAWPFRRLFRRREEAQTQEPAQEQSSAPSSRRRRRYNIDVDLGADAAPAPDPVFAPGAEPVSPAREPGDIFKKPALKKAEPVEGLEDLVSKISSMGGGKPAEKAETAEKPGKTEKDGKAVSVMETADGQQKLYAYPPSTLLAQASSVNAQDVSEELKSNAARLVDTLRSFGVETRITDICRGPAVTRYELQPSAGVKISRITSLSDDIALNLAAAGVRIEAPIPNKAAVGIEVPNKTVSVVHMREIVDSKEFRDAQSRLTVSLGRDIAGKVAVADIAKMPHLLIAGATGSGKSVCINSIIISLLYKGTPDEVKFLMVDPKVVELGIYNGIPHLLVPVVTDPRKAAGALGWAVTEMLNRYKTFADNNVRDIRGFNALARKTEGMAPMPQIVIIIDELADLMMAAPNEVEDAICRLAQMARAAGMHLVIATQRPSVDVITGVIKANIPSRIAFAVSSQVDSRTILDMGGAEKLLGRGDMLYLPVGASKPVRVQGCFVSDNEVEEVVDFIKNGSSSTYDEDIMDEIEKQAAKEKSGGGEDSAGDADPMLPQAIECVIEAGMASTSLLQRRLKLGYARAARIVDEMESRGIVGPFEGSKPRQVLMTRQQWLEMNMKEEPERNG